MRRLGHVIPPNFALQYVAIGKCSHYLLEKAIKKIVQLYSKLFPGIINESHRFLVILLRRAIYNRGKEGLLDDILYSNRSNCARYPDIGYCGFSDAMQ